MQQAFAAYGYGVAPTGVYDATTAQVVIAFQRHFRPERIDGRADPSTISTLSALRAARDQGDQPTCAIIKHANPTRDFNNIALRIKQVNPDILIPANYYNEYALLVRTLQQQKITPKAIYSVLGGAASSYKFVKEFPEAANGIIDCNHWFNPKDKRSAELKKRVEAQGQFFSYEVFMTYTAMTLLADAIERAKSTDRAAIIDALNKSTFSNHIMPYGATQFVNGQNMGAQPLMTQVVKGDIKVIVPRDYREVEPIFPLKA